MSRLFREVGGASPFGILFASSHQQQSKTRFNHEPYRTDFQHGGASELLGAKSEQLTFPTLWATIVAGAGRTL